MYFRLGELFCGPGGIAKGALSAEIDNPKWRIIHAWANDYDQSTCDTYTHLWNRMKGIYWTSKAKPVLKDSSLKIDRLSV